MTNATVQPVSLPPAAEPLSPDALSARELFVGIRQFLAQCDWHARPGEPAGEHARREACVFRFSADAVQDVTSLALPDSPWEVFRTIAVVAQTAVELHLRTLLASSSPDGLAPAASPPLDDPLPPPGLPIEVGSSVNP